MQSSLGHVSKSFCRSAITHPTTHKAQSFYLCRYASSCLLCVAVVLRYIVILLSLSSVATTTDNNNHQTRRRIKISSAKDCHYIIIIQGNINIQKPYIKSIPPAADRSTVTFGFSSCPERIAEVECIWQGNRKREKERGRLII